MALTPPPPAPQRGNRSTFANLFDAFITWLINFVTELGVLVAGLNTLAAGSAYAIPYVIDLSSTADADPTAGKLRFNSATQNAATTIYLDLLGSDGVDYTSLLDQFDASTSAVKGQVRMVKVGDPTKFLTFDVTARTTATGYRKLTLTNTGGSSANPFVTNDAVVLKFSRVGDKGDIGLSGADVVLSTITISTPVAAVNFLTAFSSTYNRYVLEIEGLTLSGNASFGVRAAQSGAAVSTNSYVSVNSPGASQPVTSAGNLHYLAINPGTSYTGTVDFRNVNETGDISKPKVIGHRGSEYGATLVSGTPGVYFTETETALNLTGALSGFQLVNLNSANFTGGTIRLIGKRNS